LLGNRTRASQFIGNRRHSSRLAPIPLWSYIASKGSSAASQRQYPQAFIFDINCRISEDCCGKMRFLIDYNLQKYGAILLGKIANDGVGESLEIAI
jgi:hypothetical protein